MKSLKGNRRQEPGTEAAIVSALQQHYQLKPQLWDGNRPKLKAALQQLGFYNMYEHEKRKLQEMAKT